MVVILRWLITKTTNTNQSTLNPQRLTMNTGKLIENAYELYFEKIVRYISFRINDSEEARDLAQDVFMRLLERSAFIYEEAAERLVFTIARNLVNDYLRHHYCKQEVDRYLMDYTNSADTTTESRLAASELASLEQKKLALMPQQRRTIYMMRRFDEKSAKEISEELNISRRTVENHLYIGMNEMRDYIKACI
jgi:RNA polymerase sigma-70 factor (ECF subfamily)